MTERDIHALRAEALARLAEATQAANSAPDVESALRDLTAATQEVLGDKEAHLRPGGLRVGERQFTNAGIFLITPDRQHHLLVAEHGFPPTEFRRLAIGPVVKKEEIEYFREIGLHEKVIVTYALLAMSADGARFTIENEIWTPGGERAAVVRSTGGWLDLRARKLIAPPPELQAVFAQVPRAPGFVELAPAAKKNG